MRFVGPRSLAFAAAGAALVTPWGPVRADDDYQLQFVIMRVMADPVAGRFIHRWSAEVDGRPFPEQQAEYCLSPRDQQELADRADTAARISTYGGCYGSLLRDEADIGEIVEHCDAVEARGDAPALAEKTMVMRITRTRQPIDRWTIDVRHTNAHFVSSFERVGACG